MDFCSEQAHFLVVLMNICVVCSLNWSLVLYSGITVDSPLTWVAESICSIAFSGELLLWYG